MVLEAEASVVVPRTGREVLELVLDLDRYRLADSKIGRVIRPIQLDETGVGTARYWGRLRGTPPAPDTNIVRLTPWAELTFTGAPRQPARLVLDFTGRFQCNEQADGCTVTHSYRMAFHRPFRWLYEPLNRDWLQRGITEEMARLAQLLDGDA